MKINEFLNNKSMLISLAGTLDETSSGDVEMAVKEILDKEGVEEVVVDLSGVRYISSAGIRVLIIAHKEAIKKNKKIVLKDMSEKVTDVLTTVGILPLFEIRKGLGR